MPERFITSAPESFCNTSDPEILCQVLIDFDRTTTNFFRWTVGYEQDQLAELIARKSGIDFGAILNLEPIERGRSGRIIRLKIVGEKQSVIVGKELEIRKWLSESHLYSSAFVVEKVFENRQDLPSKFLLHGAGWGHGVGMCQIGAAVMSRRGFSPQQILKHYFSGAKIDKLYP
jgi:SpoIID/LytB domain protein